ncbi:hypothetical protein CGH39_26430, partial [Vibrio parahaemolyticus]
FHTYAFCMFIPRSIDAKNTIISFGSKGFRAIFISDTNSSRTVVKPNKRLARKDMLIFNDLMWI